MLKKGDIVLVGVIIVAVVIWFAAASIFRGKSEDKIAVVKQDDKVLRRIDLDTMQSDERINISGSYSEVILVEKGRIRFEEADCPDKVCVKTGWLTKKGDVAVCLPNHTIIKIEGDSNKIDGVAY